MGETTGRGSGRGNPCAIEPHNEKNYVNSSKNKIQILKRITILNSISLAHKHAFLNKLFYFSESLFLYAK